MSEPVIPPDLIQAVLSELSTCLCAQILTDGLPPVCVCGVLPGQDVAMDYAGDCDDACGMAWVRLNTAYPSTRIAEPAQNPGNCAAGIGVEVELGIMRCLDVGDGTEPPSPAVLAAATVLQVADMMAMWRAIMCCRQSKDWIVGQYVPNGPTGGLVGGTVPVAIWVG